MYAMTLLPLLTSINFVIFARETPQWVVVRPWATPAPWGTLWVPIITKKAWANRVNNESPTRKEVSSSPPTNQSPPPLEPYRRLCLAAKPLLLREIAKSVLPRQEKGWSHPTESHTEITILGVSTTSAVLFQIPTVAVKEDRKATTQRTVFG